MTHAVAWDPTPGNIERGARAAEQTQTFIEQLVESQAQLLAAQAAADAREIKMLFWTRLAGIGAIAALAVAMMGIIVTIMVA